MDQVVVFIYLPGQATATPAGVFQHWPADGIGRFNYGNRYRVRHDALAVDPVGLPLSERESEGTANEGVFGGIRDSAPDYWGRLVIASELGTDPQAVTEVDYLLRTNATRVGNLDFRPEPDSPEPKLAPPSFNELGAILDAAQELAEGHQVPRHLIQLLRQGASVGGARPKCTLMHEEQLWLAKFPCERDGLNFPRLEYACLRLAGFCGIRTPEARIVEVGTRDVLLVKRFDRECKDGLWTRHGFLSALSLRQWDERDRQAWSYVSLAQTMRQHTGSEDIKELFRRMVFNILIRNTDDHPRNHGFLLKGPDLELSPAYDLVPRLTREGVNTAFELAMSVGERGRTATLDNALSRCRQFGLSEEEARAVIDDLLTVARDWPELFEQWGLPGSDIDIVRPSILAVGL